MIRSTALSHLDSPTQAARASLVEMIHMESMATATSPSRDQRWRTTVAEVRRERLAMEDGMRKVRFESD